MSPKTDYIRAAGRDIEQDDNWQNMKPINVAAMLVIILSIVAGGIVVFLLAASLVNWIMPI